MTKYNIYDMNKIAKERHGKCLSDIYVNCKSKLKWQCSCGYIWRAIPTNIMSGKWCPKCGGTLRKTIEDMQELAAQKEGKCLSDKYHNNRHKLEWECCKGHQWLAKPNDIVQGKWCPECQKSTIEDMVILAATHGGRCLSEDYLGINHKLLWECCCGYQWHTRPAIIKTGSWCPRCAGRENCNSPKKGFKKPIYTIRDLQHWADKCHMSVLSTEYKGLKYKYEFLCSNGHQITKTAASVKSQKGGCYKCNCKSSIEEMCRFVIEEMSGFSFPPNRALLKGLELDGYNHNLQIAFECHGEQHYKFVPHWHKKVQNFYKCKQRDERKRIQLSIKGINLIEIPFREAKSKSSIEKFIAVKLKSYGIQPKALDWKLFKLKSSELSRLKRSCESNDLFLLTDTYINARTHVHVRCNKCHRTWETIPYLLNKGHGCRSCSLSKSWSKRKNQNLDDGGLKIPERSLVDEY